MRQQSRTTNLALSAALSMLILSGCPPKDGPTANFSAAPQSGPAPLTVQFSDLSDPGDGVITARAWDFGDGGIADTPNPAHEYANAGTYDVTLTVTTGIGSNTLSRADCVTVTEGGETGPFVEVPDPLSGDNPRYPLPAAAVPAAGAAVNDAAFGTSQRRVVQAERMRHEYAKFDPFNADYTRILLQYLPDGEWRVYATATVPYDTAGQLVRVVAMEEPRWDPADPDILWGSRDFQVLTLDVASGVETIVKDFSADTGIGPILAAEPDLYRITMRDEGETSLDKRYFAFAIQGQNDDYRIRHLFVWDRIDDEVEGTLALSAAESIIDWVGMSPLGNWVLIGGEWDNAGDLAGLTMANRALTQFHRLDYTTAHADVGLDSNGNEVVVMQNTQTDYIDLIPISLTTLPIIEANGEYAGTNRTPLVRLFYDSGSAIGLRSGVHISCEFAGYAVVSTTTEAGEPEQNWLDRTVTLVTLDPAHPRVFYLAKVFGTVGAYWEETHAAMARDGSRVIWTTNWGQHAGDERVWDMQLDMPAGWPAAL